MQMTSDMPIPVDTPPGTGEGMGPFGPWMGQPHGPMPDFPVDRAAIVEWFHDMVEARIPEGIPLPWDHGGPCHDPGPAVIGL